MKKILLFIPIALILATLSDCVGGNEMNFTPVKRTNSADNNEDMGIHVTGGKVYMAYGRTEPFIGTQELWTAVMDEDGTNFSETLRRTFPDADSWESQYVQIQAVGTKVYLAWVEDDATPDAQVWTAVMNTDGSGWSATKRTNTLHDYTEVHMQVSGDKVYLVYGSREAGVWGFRTVSMDLDGSNWTVLNIYTFLGTSWSGVRFQVVGNKIYYFWEETNAAGEIDTFYIATMNTDGTGWDAQSVHTVDHNLYHVGAYFGWTGYHRMCVKGNHIYLAWIEKQGTFPNEVGTLWTGRIATDKSGFSSAQRYYDASKDFYELEIEIWNNIIYYITRWEDPGVWLQGPICTAIMNLDGSGFELIERTNTTDNRNDVNLAIGDETIQYVYTEEDGGVVLQIWTIFGELPLQPIISLIG